MRLVLKPCIILLVMSFASVMIPIENPRYLVVVSKDS